MDKKSEKYNENPSWKCRHDSGPNVRNLIVCIDGTANQFGQKNTNVIELYNLIMKEDDDNQLTWYNSGIGTYARPSWRSLKYYRKVIDYKIDLAIAWNFERTILAAYRWLSENYRKGDRIFLFGFSRGAFQVRVLAAMINKVGLIHKGNEEQIPFAYELYADLESDKPSSDVSNVGLTEQDTSDPGMQDVDGPVTRESTSVATRFRKIFASRTKAFRPQGADKSSTEGKTSMAARFKETFSHEDANVHFVGVWDTVSSIGLVRGKYMLPGTVDGMKHVCYFRHALALDERRVKIAPEYAYGGSATSPSSQLGPACNSEEPPNPKVDGPPQTPHETHSLLGTRSEIPSGTAPSTTPSDATPSIMQSETDSSVDKPKAERVGPPQTSETGTYSEAQLGTIPAITPLETSPTSITHSEVASSIHDPKVDGPPLAPDVSASKIAPCTQDSKADNLPQTHDVSFAATPRKLAPSTSNTKVYNPLQTLEVWFAGTHSDIGGGNVINATLDRSRPPLRWMVFEAASAGLRTKPFRRVLSSSEQIEVKESLTGVRWILEFLPISRLTYSRRQNGKETTHVPHLGRARKIHRGQKIHGSLMLANDKGYEYVPKARLPDDEPSLWSRLHSIEGLGDWKAVDLFEGTQDLLKRYIDQEDKTVWELLRKTAMTVDGRQAVYEGAISTLIHTTKTTVTVPVKIDFICNVMDILEETETTGRPLRECESDKVKAAFDNFKDTVDDIYISIARRFLGLFTIFNSQTQLKLELELPMPEHDYDRYQDFPSTLAISPNNELFTSRGDTYYTWVSGALKKHSFQGSSETISCLAVSPDGKVLVSGFDDGTICFRENDTHMPVMSTSKGHGRSVTSLVFSSNSERVASAGGEDVRIWDVACGKQIGKAFKAANQVIAAIFTHGGERIMVLSSNRIIEIWDVVTHTMVENPFFLGTAGSVVWVRCGAFSSDGRRVVVGAMTGDLSIWDLSETPQTFRKRCWPHEKSVLSVAFSPDNTKIASSSMDSTVHISDTETQELEGILYHKDRVTSVSFFPGGKHVASVCDDGMIRIWDFGT